MPTKKQLHKRWRTDFALGINGPYGNASLPPDENDFTGNMVGTITYDPETKKIATHPLHEKSNPEEKEKTSS